MRPLSEVEMKMSGNVINSDRNTSIQVLKGFGAILIFLFHGTVPFFVEHMSITMLALNLFFVLSGFMMAYSYSDRELEVSFLGNIKFAIKKVSALYGLYVITAIPFIFLLVMKMIQNPKDIGKYLLIIVLTLTLNQCWAVKDTMVLGINSPAWFLSTLMFLYLAFPSIWKKIKRAKSNKSLYIAAAVLVCAKFISSFLIVSFHVSKAVIWWVNDISPISRLVDFTVALIAGRIFFTYIENNEGPVFGKVKASVLEIVFIALAVVAGTTVNTDVNNVVLKALFADFTIIYLFINIPLAILFYNCEGIITRLFNHQPFIYFGEVSSYFYLIHYFFAGLVIMVIEMSVGTLPWMVKAIFLVIMFFISFAFSALANRVYKKKANRRSKN